MKVAVKAITEVINKISNITAGDKQIPGVLFSLSENQLDVCYSDGHKSFIQRVAVTTEEGDKIGSVAVDFAQLQRAIMNCQPYDRIAVDEISIKYNDNTLGIKAEQIYREVGEDGSIAREQKVAEKKMNIPWKEPGSDMRSSVLTRMNYESIFEAEGKTDEYNKDELIDALNRTTSEKNKTIYFSRKTQSVFVQNQAHLTAIPISRLKELTDEEKDTIRGELTEAGTFTDEAYKSAIDSAQNRINYSMAINTQHAKAITSVFSGISADTIYVLPTEQKFVKMFVDTEDEHIGFWFELAQSSKAHTGAFERYSSLGYKSYQTNFLRAVLVNSVESALKATNSEKVAVQFKETENGIALIVNAESSQKSIADAYDIVADDIIDPTHDLTAKTFNISLNVLSDMLKQLKTNLVAFDFDCGENGVNCIRISEIDDIKLGEEYIKARQRTEELCKQQAVPFDANSTPTPVELKLDYRNRILNVKQFTMLAK